ncbi:hypothetical protein HETIRDRAFT_417412 [Heterobasidion irregulare TC 32-1]|uniref:Uncharacterized protein n=1 Tax=Heterobasidion irregulare (strain TC 32-1) TaxID=747525 RepID=W4K611_HETIT|nr:uncharacterized protein HETIRDRAFT_417412 [Heterobasidion irregulare TC 32-1]ETW81248.1 hypothetical protein HETIRDRAFT_417412 [Heterobasidion irregulare TC 32-1]
MAVPVVHVEGAAEPVPSCAIALKGVYMSWTNDPSNPGVEDWNVTEIKIDPNRGRIDKSTVAHSWKMPDMWTTQNKPSLMMA